MSRCPVLRRCYGVLVPVATHTASPARQHCHCQGRGLQRTDHPHTCTRLQQARRHNIHTADYHLFDSVKSEQYVFSNSDCVLFSCGWRIRSDKYINGILNTRILDNDVQWFLILDGCNCWAAVAGWGEAQCCHLRTVSPVSSSQSQPGTRAVDTRGAAVAISGYRWLQVATGGCRWLQVATGGCKGWYQCFQWSWWPSPAFSWPRWCPPPGPRTSRFSATSASTGSTQMGSGMDFFLYFLFRFIVRCKT